MAISGNYRIDALLRGADARWNSQLPFGTPTVVTYGFMDAVPGYYYQQPGIVGFSAQDFSTFSALDSAHRDLVRNEFAQLSNAIPGLKFTEVSNPNAAVVLVGALRYDAAAFGNASGYVPNGADTVGNLNASGDVWFNLNSEKYDLSRTMLWSSLGADPAALFGGTIPSGYLQYVGGTFPLGINEFEDMVIHEIGHALGLKHPGDSANYGVYGGAGTGSNAPPYLPANEDDSMNTMMSYNGNYAGPEPRPYDIAALRFLYGATPPSDGRWLLATGGSSAILGSSLNELIWPGQGTHSIDGGAGTDTAQYSGVRSAYTIAKTSTGYTVSGGTNGNDTLTNMERLKFADGTLALDTGGGETAGEVYRLYKAAFNRPPDNGGLKYWIGVMDAGSTVSQVASGFVESAEFASIYGVNLSNDTLVTKFYQNVLSRQPEQLGYDYWMGQLNNSLMSRNEVLAAFSESAENQANLVGVIQDGIWLA